MRYVAAYLLATLGGKSNPSKEDIVEILSSCGLDVDDDKLGKVSVSIRPNSGHQLLLKLFSN